MDKAAVKEIVRKANRSEIHRRTGISLSGVSRILSGKRTARTGNLFEIAGCLGLSIDDLYSYLRGRVKKRKMRPAA